MRSLHKLFFDTLMTWKRVILVAVSTAVLTAAILIIPGVRETSASYLGVTPEAWFLFALYVILNCRDPIDAALKTFVFFLISQPLIYLIQVPFNPLGWQIFMYYPYWLKITLLTLPGAALAWYVKKDKLISALILSVATGYIGVTLAASCFTVVQDFPGELIRTVFCLLEILLFLFVLLKKKRNRIVCGILTLAVMAAFTVYKLSGRADVYRGYYELPAGHTWEIRSTEGYVGNVEMGEDGLEILAKKYSYETVTVVNELGEEMELYMTYAPEQGLEIVEQEK